MSDSFHDEELARLYRDAPRAEPPPALDAAILAAARREAGAGLREALAPGRVPFYSRWPIPLSLAAVVVISASLVFLVEHERALETEALYAPPEQGAARPAPRPDGPTPSKDKTGMPLPAPVLPAQPAAGAQPFVRQSQPDTGQAPAMQQASPAGPPVSEPGKPANAIGEDWASAGSAPFKLESSAADRPSPAKQDVPQAAVEAIRPLRRADPAAAAPGASGAVATKRPEMNRESAEARAERASAMRTTVDAVAESAEAWLARIEALRREGKVEAAERSLAEFRKRYPDYPLPAHLKAP
jgi:hypothetical protein